MNSYILHTDYGRKRFVKRKQIQELLLSGAQLEQLSPNEYRYRPQTFHAFADLAPLQQQIQQPAGKPYLPGTFIFQLGQKRIFERLESEFGLAMRLSSTNLLT